ncbi:hypothetical protein GY45DRAFT_490626 [Cubamyces sp. BRFM 1775]|nr:hypothetical protein GY45DRAFT_490626 [Cubamyces sp. BRFM 1775]
MFALLTLVSSALALASGVAADFIPAGTAAHIFSTQNTSLALAPEAAASNAYLEVTLPGDGSSADSSAFYIVSGSGVPSQIAYGDWCITAKGVVPESSSQILYIAECDATDSAQLWTLNENPSTISNADGNCITLGRPANGVSVVLDFCEEELQDHQLWVPKAISA